MLHDRGQDNLGAGVSVLTFNLGHRSPSVLAVLLVGMVVPALACESSTLRPDAGSGSVAGSCTKDSDCGAGFACGYRIADGCSAVLSCQTAPNPGNDVPIYYCGCDGTPVLTTGGYVYTFKPVSGFANDQSFPNCSTDAGARD